MIRTALQQATSLLRGLRVTPTQQQQTRNTVIMRRMYPPALRKKGLSKALKKREYVYVMEENTTIKPWGEMEVLLTQDVEGIGMKGDLLSVNKRTARHLLLPTGMAIYASPENIKELREIMKDEPERPRQSVWAKNTTRKLAAMNLPVPMNPNVPWVLNKTHIRVAFRLVGVEMTDDCLTLPAEPITEPQEVFVKILMNQMDEVSVKAIVYHYYSEPTKAPGGVLPELPPVWNHTEPVYTFPLLETLKQEKTSQE